MSVLDLVTRLLVNLYVPFALSTPVTNWAREHRLADLQLDGWQAFLLLFFGLEFCYYWFHRASHRMRWFWVNHSIHHSPNQLNLAAAVRIGIFGKVTGTFVFFVPLVWLGFDAKLVGLALTVNLLYQFWIHATWLPRLGWLEGILNTPSAHRVHHACNPQYIDANYGGVLLIFDRLFGTYVPERDDVKLRYGLVKPILSNNPLKVWFTGWLDLLRDLASARSLREAMGYVVMPPGWRPGLPVPRADRADRDAVEVSQP
ncbi:sterol desaturase family protein [Aquabacterium parvum]|uniref:sterol desaturase family protein n=1 Tax=Aquabacterium parvum TaxID=70584 RepID=UPI000ADD6EAC|nr:sterol desaturase family protein [Aquabacterium parvum]MBU0917187.1 sterol desaturase family protein [Gammaproteobacteria bacterium]